MKNYAAIVFICTYVSVSAQQTVNTLDTGPMNLQYGFSCKASMEIGDGPPQLNIALASGIGSNFLTSELYPSMHAELLVYSGKFGTAKPFLRQNWFTMDLILAMTMTVGKKNVLRQVKEEEALNRNIPLYYFSNYGYSPLVNPYSTSFSLGTNLVFSSQHEFQRLGFIGLHPIDRLQICYYNDGGPIVDFLRLGDLQDRYYTGGGIISYRGAAYTQLNLIEVGYHKFTGYSKNSYQVAKRLNQAYVSYADRDQAAYNRSMWSLNLASSTWGLNLREYNRTTWDMQHKIHWGGFSPYHLVSHERRLTVSGQYYLSNTYLSLR